MLATHGYPSLANFNYRVTIIFLISAAWVLTPTYAVAIDTTDTADKTPQIQVTTSIAKQADWAISIPAQGEILPWEVAIISAKTNGVGATQIAVLEGDKVTKGQVLATFDNRLLTAELAQAKASLALASANEQLAATNLKRVQQLKQKRTISEQEFDQIASQAAAANANKAQANAAVMLANIRLSDATLIASEDGKILERNLELGQVPALGAPLFRILRDHKLEWVAEIDAADLAQVDINFSAEVKLANEQVVKGHVRSISPQLTSGARIAKVRVLLDGTPNIPVNTYASGRINIGQSNAVIIPAASLVIKDGKTWVFRVKNMHAEQVAVSIGRRQQNELEILAGVQAGDVLVLEGAGFLNNGDKVATQAKSAAGAKL